MKRSILIILVLACGLVALGVLASEQAADKSKPDRTEQIVDFRMVGRL